MTKDHLALDTSFVMRLVTRDPIPLFQIALAFLDEGDQPLHLSDLVLAETYFALQYHYGFSKPDALAALRQLVGHPRLTPTMHAREILALPDLATAKPGFADRLIHGTAHAAGQTLVTFEKAAKKLPATLVLEG